MIQNSPPFQREEDSFSVTSSIPMWGNTVSHALSSGFLEFLATHVNPLECLDISLLAHGTGQQVLSAPIALTASSSAFGSVVLGTYVSQPPFQSETLDALSSFQAARERMLVALRDLSAGEDATIYEPDPQRVDLDRLRRLRGIGAHETEDLYDWYAQKEE